MKSVIELKVGLNFGDGLIPVGRLAILNNKIYFEYYQDFILKGLALSPLRLPLKPGVSSFDHKLFEGLPGVFSDSLPDGWGRLLLDRFFRSQGIMPEMITPLDRLAFVGLHGLGALVYEPDHSIHSGGTDINLDRLAQQAEEVLNGESEEVLGELLALNGSSAGARPKALIGLNEHQNRMIHGVLDLPSGYTPWIVKFRNSQDGPDSGAIEYVYALMAKDSGICMPDVRLLPAQNGPGYFSVKRFDRDGNRRFHMHTASGLLHSDFRSPSLDYEDLSTLTGILTRDTREIKKMLRLAVFNVLACNRDDHGKNFSFLMDSTGEWKFAPAYDLTFSSGPNGEQSTMVMGEGKNPGREHLLKLGSVANISAVEMAELIDQIQESLSQWPDLAKTYGVFPKNIERIRKHIKA